MLELPEALTMASLLNTALAGRAVTAALPPSKAHKFCWFNGDPAAYDAALCGRRFISARGFGIFAEISFEGGLCLCFNDGVNVRLVPREDAPRDFQLLLALDDGRALVFTVAMYGGIVLHKGDYDNAYYLSSLAAVSPFEPGFADHYYKTLAACKPNLSAKAFLATDQRFPGIGNGTLQDILFNARIHPRRKLGTLCADERRILLSSAVSTLRQMTDLGGRDTEKNLFGEPGGYTTLMSRNTPVCPVCGGSITKEAYLGGSVYYCPVCQPLPV